MHAYICYLLLRAIRFFIDYGHQPPQYIPSPENIHQQLAAQYSWFALYIVALGTIMFFQAPIAIVMSMVPRHRYIPKRLRYRTRFKKKWAQLANLLSIVTIVSGQGLASMPFKCKMGWHGATQRTLMAFSSISTSKPRLQTTQMFDENNSDSFIMVIDNACSYCITNDLKHYVMPPEDIETPVKGIGGIKVRATKRGTVKWSFTNDQGQVHDEYIPNTYYHQTSPYCLYSPQHVAQVAKDHYP